MASENDKRITIDPYILVRMFLACPRTVQDVSRAINDHKAGKELAHQNPFGSCNLGGADNPEWFSVFSSCKQGTTEFLRPQTGRNSGTRIFLNLREQLKVQATGGVDLAQLNKMMDERFENNNHALLGQFAKMLAAAGIGSAPAAAPQQAPAPAAPPPAPGAPTDDGLSLAGIDMTPTNTDTENDPAVVDASVAGAEEVGDEDAAAMKAIDGFVQGG